MPMTEEDEKEEEEAEEEEEGEEEEGEAEEGEDSDDESDDEEERPFFGALSGRLVSQVLLVFIGVILGVAGSWVAVRQLKMEFVFSPDVVLMAFLFSVVIGVVFGFLPARKAARLDPIQALRHE